MTNPMLAPTTWIGAADCPLRGVYAGTATAAPALARGETEHGSAVRHPLNSRPAAAVPGAARTSRLTRVASDGREG